MRNHVQLEKETGVTRGCWPCEMGDVKEMKVNTREGGGLGDVTARMCRLYYY